MQRSTLNLSNTKLLTCDQGNLVPISLMEVVPGDHFRHDTSMLIRTQPLFAPLMHKCTATTHHWFVPSRILQDNFEDGITGGEDGLQEPIFPTITSPAGTGFETGTLADYLGLPVGVPDMEVSAFPFRAYTSIYNEFYRDQQLQDPLVLSKADGPDITTNVDLQNAAWQKDYFTAARPSPQLGAEVTIPLTGNAPVAFDGTTGASNKLGALSVDDGNNLHSLDTAGANLFSNGGNADNGLFADLTGIAAVDINLQRLANAVQRFKERSNRGGARYTEWLSSFFKIRSQDSRLQIPEYIGGGRTNIQFSEVLSTADNTGSPVGALSGHGIAAGRSNRYSFKAPEHGYIITVLCVRPKTMYTQGLHKLWSRNSKFDYLIPDFANLGDQEILNKELYAQHTLPQGTFGFVPRYDDYRTIPNTISGAFRNTLDFWHLGRVFDSDPALNSDFVTANPTDRVYAVADEDQLQIQVLNNVKVKRAIPKVARPYLY